MTIAKAAIRRVWEPQPPSTRFTVIVQPRGQFRELKLWTTDAWLASLANHYADAGKRPEVTVTYDDTTKELKNIPLLVTA